MPCVRQLASALAIAAFLAAGARSATVVDGAIVGTWRCPQPNGYGPIYYAFAPDGQGTSHIPAEATVRLGFETHGGRLATWPVWNPRAVSRAVYSVAGDVLAERPANTIGWMVCARVSRNWSMPDAKAGIPDFAVDDFIDPGVPIAQRAYVRKAILALPPDEREYVWGWDPAGNVFSNRFRDYAAMERGTDGFFSGLPQAVDPAIVGSWDCSDMQVRYRGDGTGTISDRRETWAFVFATRGATVMQRDAVSRLGAYGMRLERYRFTRRRDALGFERCVYWREGDGWTPPSSAVDRECRRA